MIDEIKLRTEVDLLLQNRQITMKTMKLMHELIDSQPKTDWIPCEVEMPKDETLMYWTTHEDGSIIMHGYLKRNGFIYNWEVDDLEKRKRQGKVVAWMPIFKPQPYKKEGAE